MFNEWKVIQPKFHTILAWRVNFLLFLSTSWSWFMEVKDGAKLKTSWLVSKGARLPLKYAMMREFCFLMWIVSFLHQSRCVSMFDRIHQFSANPRITNCHHLAQKRGLQAIYDRPKGGNFLDSNSSCTFGPTKPRRVKTHQLDLLPSQLASGKWRFRLGSRVNPTHQDLKNHRTKLILLSRFFLSERCVSFSTGKTNK